MVNKFINTAKSVLKKYAGFFKYAGEFLSIVLLHGSLLMLILCGVFGIGFSFLMLLGLGVIAYYIMVELPPLVYQLRGSKQ